MLGDGRKQTIPGIHWNRRVRSACGYDLRTAAESFVAERLLELLVQFCPQSRISRIEHLVRMTVCGRFLQSPHHSDQLPQRPAIQVDFLARKREVQVGLFDSQYLLSPELKLRGGIDGDQVDHRRTPILRRAVSSGVHGLEGAFRMSDIQYSDTDPAHDTSIVRVQVKVAQAIGNLGLDFWELA